MIDTPDLSKEGVTSIENKKIFHAQIGSIPLKNFVKITGLLTDTAKLYITPKDISIKAIDKAKVALVNINIGKSVFDKYNATTFELGLDLDRIRKIIDLAKANELVDIQFIQEKNQLVVAIGELKALMGIVDFRDIPDLNPEIMEVSGKVTLKAGQLKRGEHNRQ